MTDAQPACPECSGAYASALAALHVSRERPREWPPAEAAAPADEAAAAGVVRDANGNPLAEGDDVIVVKDLPVKGAPKPIKSGTKVRNIRLVAPDLRVGDHDLDCKVDGFGPMQLKSSLVRKA